MRSVRSVSAVARVFATFFTGATLGLVILGLFYAYNADWLGVLVSIGFALWARYAAISLWDVYVSFRDGPDDE